MTKQQYLNALKKLDVAPYSIAAGDLLGLEHSQLARLASGKRAPTPMLERLLAALIELKNK